MLTPVDNLYLFVGIVLIIMVHYYMRFATRLDDLTKIKFATLLWWCLLAFFIVWTIYMDFNIHALSAVALFGSVRATIILYKKLVIKNVNRV